ncbi:hypothetical protein SAMN05443574_1124 [Haloarcula vallismortis]|uniref:Uncharacterized protein n=1 Tax=Haloarcula vallismortis TaxID=28442 RepID=A0A1H2Y9F4_HALVA|nr:hypothetical protein SAMN05443574_1124 [Haloarcula vallismortis]
MCARMHTKDTLLLVEFIEAGGVNTKLSGGAQGGA